MKRILFTLFAVLAVTAAGAQGPERMPWDELNGMLFPEFREGTVYFRNGRNSKQVLNYDPYSQRIIFIQDGQLMFIHNLDAINYMVIDDRIFIRYMGDVFFEEIISGKGYYYINHKTLLEDPAGMTGFGFVDAGFNSTAAVSTPNMMPIQSGRGILMKYDLIPTKRYGINMEELAKVEELYLYTRDRGFIMFKSARDLSLVYGHRKEIARFKRKNKLDLNNRNDVDRLVEYAASLQ